MRYTKQEIVQATCRWLATNPEQAVIVVDDHGVSWAVPRQAQEAIQLAEAVQEARSALRHPAGRH
jgi:hypothetical protein